MTPQAVAAAARANVSRAIELLEQPSLSALERTTSELAEAATRIGEIQSQASEAGSAARAALGELRSDLGRVRLLLSHAWEFRARSSGQAVYTEKGVLSAAPAATVRWVFEG